MYLRRTIDTDLTLYTSRAYPFSLSNCKGFKEQSIIAIGGNIGDVKRRFNHLLRALNSSRLLKVCASSRILKNPPFGYSAQPHFYNAALLIATSIPPLRLLMFLERIERRFKRVRSFKDAPRTLDLDIIFYGNRHIASRRLNLPHPRWQERSSVIIPLMDILP